MQIRLYQDECVNAIFKEWETVQSTLACLPTGLGKTRVASEVILRCQPKRALFLAHREELIFQAQRQIKLATGLESEIEMGDIRASVSLFNNMPVMISTIQTQVAGKNGGRMKRFRPEDFGVIIIDEAHRGTCDSYRKILEHYKQNPNIKILGITATPDRTDEAALGSVFETVAYNYEMVKAIEEGWLVPIQQQLVTVGTLDFSEVRTTAGDLNGADLARVLEDEKNLQGMVGSAIEIIGDKKAIAFTGSVRHAEMCCQIFNRHKPETATWVCGETPTKERRDRLDRFYHSKFKVLCNVGIATEGYDCPDTEVIIMGRPTKSRLLYTQMVGRGTRALTGTLDELHSAYERKEAIAHSKKPSVLVIDYVGNSGKHKLMTTADILGGKYPEEVRELALKKAKESGKAKNVSDMLKESEEEIKSRIEKARLEEQIRKLRLIAKVQYSTRDIDPFSFLGIPQILDKRWDRGRVLSEGSRKILAKIGVDPDKVGYAQGMQLVQAQVQRWQKNLCTFKQAKVLTSYGYHNAAKMTMKEASQAIDKIAANGWKKRGPIEQKDVPEMAVP